MLLAAERLIFLGEDPAFQLEGEPRGFTLKFHGQYSLDGGILVRDHILSYQVDGDQVVRINPPALTAEDFLDEWITMPWKDAARWSDPSHLSDLRRWHSFLHEEKYWTSGALLFVQPCESKDSGSSPASPTPSNPIASSPTQWQIGLGLNPRRAEDASLTDDSESARQAQGVYKDPAVDEAQRQPREA